MGNKFGVLTRSRAAPEDLQELDPEIEQTARRNRKKTAEKKAAEKKAAEEEEENTRKRIARERTGKKTPLLGGGPIPKRILAARTIKELTGKSKATSENEEPRGRSPVKRRRKRNRSKKEFSRTQQKEDDDTDDEDDDTDDGASPHDFAKADATPPKLKENIQQLLSDTGNKKQNTMESLMGILPLLIMQQGGFLGGQLPFGSEDIEELNNQVEKEQPQAEEAIEKMENLMDKLRNLKEVVAKESKDLDEKKKKGCNCKKSEKAVKDLEKAIDVVDVTDALKICQGKLKKYKHYLVYLNNYSATLQKLARDLNTKLNHTIRKTKSCPSFRKKKSTPIPKKNEKRKKRKNNSKKSKSKD
tara:strand:+ start:6034 stop:7107 length:1074 start_codon:yes stop_codon:yes gene_type:complete